MNLASVNIISVRESPQYKDIAIRYFQRKWSEVEPVIYENSINFGINAKNPLP